MTVPPEHVQVQVYAEVCDAADPFLEPDERTEAAERAADLHPAFTIAVATTALAWLMAALRAQLGDDTAADLMAQMRVACGTMPVWNPEDAR